MGAISDLDWLGLERHGEGTWSFELTGPLSRFDGKFYGGTGIAVTTALLEAETERAALWATVQFAGSANVGDRIDCQVEVLASGRRTSQVRMTASVGDRVMLAAIGATGESRTGEVNAQFGTMPDVGSPDDAPPWRPNVPFAVDFERASWLQIAELRDARMPGRPHGLWARLRDRPQTRASLGFLADMVPSAVVQAGTSGRGDEPRQRDAIRSGARNGLDPRRLRPVLHGRWLRPRRRADLVARRHAARDRQPDRDTAVVRLTPMERSSSTDNRADDP